jgi:predicted nucleotidyltransferase
MGGYEIKIYNQLKRFSVMSVLSHLTQRGRELILSEYEKSNIRTSIATLRTRLGYYFNNGEIRNQFVFGSFDRDTILPRSKDENSDIDYMIVFNNPQGLQPQTLLNQLRRFVETYYSRSEIYQSSPTIVLELGHIKFELVPALQGSVFSTEEYLIPSPVSSYLNWTGTNPSQLKRELNDKNVQHNSLIKPLIRILKYWNALNGKVFSSYELEKHIINQSYWFCNNLKDCFYIAVESLNQWGLPDYKATKLQRLKSIVAETKRLENAGYGALAEIEIKKVIP